MLNDPNRLIDIAEQMRTTAEGPCSGECRRTLHTLAEQYYRLAEMAQTRLDFEARQKQRQETAGSNR